MFGDNKRHILADGKQALAVVTDVEYAKFAGMTVARNYNYKLTLTLTVRPDGDAPFETYYSDYFPQYSQPQTGAEFWVRYDPSDQAKVELDLEQIAQDNSAFDAQVAAQ